jgi:hypothetical protein
VNVLLHTHRRAPLLSRPLANYWQSGPDGTIWSSAFVAAVFAVHPLHVESVAGVFHAHPRRLRLLRTTSYNRSISATVDPLCARLMAKPMLVTVPFVHCYSIIGHSSESGQEVTGKKTVTQVDD